MKYFLLIEEMPIVKRLEGTKFKDNFINLVEYAAPILEKGPSLSSIGFTPHDFSHHVKDIYSLLDKMLPKTFYEKYNTGENLFVLLTGVLFHDIGMTKEWSDEVRVRHSEIGKHEFLEPFKENKIDSVIKQNIDAMYSEYIADIIYAHSDIKLDDGSRTETFREIYNKYEGLEYSTKGNQEEINVPFLAAVVRLADELDITYGRIENINYLKSNNLPSSLQHFRLCELFKDVQLSKHEDALIIVVDESKCNLQLIDQEIEDSANNSILKLATEAANILERYEKIRGEFKMLNDLVLRNTSYSSDEIWQIRRIELAKIDKLIEAAKKKE